MVFLVVLFQVVCHNLLGLGMHCFKFFCISKFSLRNQLCFNRFFFINYLLLSLINFNTLSLICLPRVLTMRDQGDFLFSFCLLGSLWASYNCIGVSFLSLGNFSSMIMLKAWSMPWLGILLSHIWFKGLDFYCVPHFPHVPYPFYLISLSI